MYFFSFIALCLVKVFDTLNLLVIPGIGLGFGYILLGMTVSGALFKFILLVSGLDVGIVSNSNRQRDSSGISIVNSPGSAVAVNNER